MAPIWYQSTGTKDVIQKMVSTPKIPKHYTKKVVSTPKIPKHYTKENGITPGIPKKRVNTLMPQKKTATKKRCENHISF